MSPPFHFAIHLETLLRLTSKQINANQTHRNSSPASPPQDVKEKLKNIEKQKEAAKRGIDEAKAAGGKKDESNAFPIAFTSTSTQLQMGKKNHSSKFQKVAQISGDANKKRGSNKRGSCGGRNPEKRAKRFERWGTVCDPARLKDAQSCKALHIHRIKSFPSDFLNIRPSGKTVRETVAKHRYPNTAAELQALPNTGKILLPLDHLDPATVPADIPPFIIMRFEHLITADEQHRLWFRWDQLLAAKPAHLLKHDKNRSASEAWHLGVWEITESIEAIDVLLRFIKTLIAPKISGVFQEHAPAQWEALCRAHNHVLNELGSQFHLRPNLDMGGPFFTVAAKEAGSGITHLDWNDDRAIFAFIFAVGDWEGGEFCAPQLGIKIPLRPGQVLAVLARVLAHFSAPVTKGRRIVFTCFTDKLLFRHSDPVIVIL
ncbi:hypothetical protein C8R48DRAFT_673767 [Suillus tomentosus]|nr:hypothetical protein C8R48DRAFT_673767 [Suillus tomentosus]